MRKFGIDENGIPNRKYGIRTGVATVDRAMWIFTEFLNELIEEHNQAMSLLGIQVDGVTAIEPGDIIAEESVPAAPMVPEPKITPQTAPIPDANGIIEIPAVPAENLPLSAPEPVLEGFTIVDDLSDPEAEDKDVVNPIPRKVIDQDVVPEWKGEPDEETDPSKIKIVESAPELGIPAAPRETPIDQAKKIPLSRTAITKGNKKMLLVMAYQNKVDVVETDTNEVIRTKLLKLL